jgi:hypothetical protein
MALRSWLLAARLRTLATALVVLPTRYDRRRR